MSPFERQRLFSALILLTMALFVASGYRPAARWRRQLRIAAIAAVYLAHAAACVQIALWLVGLPP